MADKPILTKKFNEGLDLGQRMKEGGILGKLYIGVQGNDLETAKKALENTIYDRLNAEKNVTLLEVKMYDIMKEKETEYFSGVAEVNVVADDFHWFVNTVLHYGPSAVEIIDPSEVHLNIEQMHSIVADISDFAHVYSQQIIAMLKDPERRHLLEQMLGKE